MSEKALDVRFGPWRLSTPLENVSDAAVTGPYALWKTAGPARLAVTDRGLTFATNGARGVRISFRRPVRGIEPLGVIRHPELTVTVADVAALAKPDFRLLNPGAVHVAVEEQRAPCSAYELQRLDLIAF